jgi:hypothetical protein
MSFIAMPPVLVFIPAHIALEHEFFVHHAREYIPTQAVCRQTPPQIKKSLLSFG